MTLLTDITPMQAPLTGASAPTFARHAGYQRMFREGALTLGVFLPLRFYQGDMQVLAGQADLVSQLDRDGFAAAWVRDVPLFDPLFGDAGQVFDPFTYLAFLAARTKRLAWPQAVRSSRCATRSIWPSRPPPSTSCAVGAWCWASPPAIVRSSSPRTVWSMPTAATASPIRCCTSGS